MGMQSADGAPEPGPDRGLLRGAGPRRLSIDDLPPCCELDRLALGGLWTPLQWRRELEDPDRLCLGFHQAPTEGEALEALATGSVILDELHVSVVAVHPERRRQGLGRRVLEALVRQGRLLGCRRATLEVAETNGAARNLYAALGFRTAGRRRCYYRNGDDALIQWMEMSTWPGGS
jgi:[ribosomal protein S18]-alanine N-acetyltransferase